MEKIVLLTNGKSILINDAKNSLNLDRVHGFLLRSSWAAKRTRATMVQSIENSLCFGVYTHTGFDCSSSLQIAFARVVTDRSTFAYLCDVFVDENYRGQGISKKLMEFILAHPDLQSYRRFTLATQDAHGLYKKFGFRSVPSDRFMEILNNDI